MYRSRNAVLTKAFERFVPDSDFRKFEENEAYWLSGYAAFMKRKEGRPEEFYHFVQYKFFSQWFRLKKYVNDLGILLIGDIPIYVAMDSADVAEDRKLFRFTEDGKPLAAAGCPPDGFSAAGMAVIPMQDYMRLGSETRINEPATVWKNWTIRFTKEMFSDKVWGEIRKITQESGRLDKE